MRTHTHITKLFLAFTSLRRALVVLLASLLLAPSTQLMAAELPVFPNTITVDGTPLVLNGNGLRTKLIFKVYAAGLYLPQKNNNATTILNSTTRKHLTIHLLREVDAKTFAESLEKGISDNTSAEDAQKIAAQTANLVAMINRVGSVKPDDVVTLAFSDASLTITINNKQLGQIQSALFNRALLAVWLGDKPADSTLKKGLLGN